MNMKFKIALAVLAGAALGAAAMQGLHAQAKPKGYLVTETEVIDPAAAAAHSPLAQAALKAAGGRTLIPTTAKVVAIVGEPPKRFGVSEWESLEKAAEYRTSAEWKALSPQRDKALKQIRSFAVEGAAN